MIPFSISYRFRGLFLSGRDNLGMDLQRCVHRVPLSGCLKPFGGVQSQKIFVKLAVVCEHGLLLVPFYIACLCCSHFGQPAKKNDFFELFRHG